MASLNSCTPVRASCTATRIRIVLVAAKNFPSEIFSVPWKKNHPTAKAHTSPSARPDPHGEAFAGKFHGAKNQGKFGAFAHHHQKHKCGQAKPGGEIALRRVGFSTRCSICFFRCRATRFIHTIMVTTKTAATSSITPSNPSSLIFQRSSAMATARLETTAASNASPHPAHQSGAARAIQIDQDDADNQSGFDTFTQSDQK